VRPHKLQVHSFDVFGKIKQNSKSSSVLTSKLTSGAKLAIAFGEYLQGKH